MLEHVKTVCPQMVTKSSIMLGCGEEDHQVLQTLRGVYGCSEVCVVIVVCTATLSLSLFSCRPEERRSRLCYARAVHAANQDALEGIYGLSQSTRQ